MEIRKNVLNKVEYFHEEWGKSKILIHHSVSSTSKSMKDWFENDKGKSKVAVAYSIDKDGTIEQFFESHLNYGYHIGKGFNLDHNKVTIGIELVNEGVLEKKGEKFYWFDGKQEYKGKVFTAKDLWRGYKYFAAYTEEQYKSLAFLITCLRGMNGVSVNKGIAPDLKFATEYFYKYGIMFHCNLREDKTDVSPAFDIKKFTAECKDLFL